VTRGKHAAGSAGRFYRDLAMMVIGILLVGAAVFLLLYLFVNDPDPVAGESTTTPTSVNTTITSVTSTIVTTTEPSTTSSTTSTTVPVRPPEEVRVLNSVGLAGAAGRKTQELADAGYQTQQAGDFDPEQDPSRIWYRDGFSAEANALLTFLPGALIESIPDPDLQQGADVVLVLGAGYTE
jgi:hypothetical protein